MTQVHIDEGIKAKIESVREKILHQYQNQMKQSKQTYTEIVALLSQLIPIVSPKYQSEITNSVQKCNEFMSQDMDTAGFDDMTKFFEDCWDQFKINVRPNLMFANQIEELKSKLQKVADTNTQMPFAEALLHLTKFEKEIREFNYDRIPSYFPLVFYDPKGEFSNILQLSRNLSHNYELYKELLIFIEDFSQIQKLICQDKNMFHSTTPSYFYAFNRLNEILEHLKNQHHD